MLLGLNVPGGGNVFTAKKNPCVNPHQTEVAEESVGSDFACSARESNKQKEGKKYEITFWWRRSKTTERTMDERREEQDVDESLMWLPAPYKLTHLIGEELL